MIEKNRGNNLLAYYGNHSIENVHPSIYMFTSGNKRQLVCLVP
ncbi:MAG: hypothetical protein ACI8UG_002040 [Gammaproteobacteria bacterium]|jgi:hypothetical protein